MTDLSLDRALVRRRLGAVALLYLCTAAVAAGFIFFYARLVCVYLCALSVHDLARTVGLIAVVQVLLRPLLWWAFPTSEGHSPGRQAYRLGIWGWVGTGILAFALHSHWYPDFDWAAHLKLLFGYWLLGGGILAQAEYLVLERLVPWGDAARAERVGRRLLESYGVFTVVPALVLLMALVRFSDDSADSMRRLMEGVYLTVFFVGAALGVAWGLGRSMAEDTKRLQRAVRAIGAGELRTRVTTSRPDELAVIAAGINQMAEGLVERDALRDALGRFTSQAVAERVMASFSQPDGRLQLGGRRVTVTLLLCDLRGFTALTERLPPEQLTALLNGWFTLAVGVIHQHGGMVDKFIGDALFAVFGLAGEPDAPAAAVGAAQDLLARIADWDAGLGESEQKLAIGIAVHTGEVTAGFFGSPERLEFTVVGSPANVVARLCSEARSPLPTLLVSESTAARVGGLTPAGELRLRGVSAPVVVYDGRRA